MRLPVRKCCQGGMGPPDAGLDGMRFGNKNPSELYMVGTPLYGVDASLVVRTSDSKSTPGMLPKTCEKAIRMAKGLAERIREKLLRGVSRASGN